MGRDETMPGELRIVLAVEQKESVKRQTFSDKEILKIFIKIQLFGR